MQAGMAYNNLPSQAVHHNKANITRATFSSLTSLNVHVRIFSLTAKNEGATVGGASGVAAVRRRDLQRVNGGASTRQRARHRDDAARLAQAEVAGRRHEAIRHQAVVSIISVSGRYLHDNGLVVTNGLCTAHIDKAQFTHRRYKANCTNFTCCWRIHVIAERTMQMKYIAYNIQTLSKTSGT